MITEFQKSVKWDALYVTAKDVWVTFHRESDQRHAVTVIEPANAKGEHKVHQLPIIADETQARNAAWDIFMQLP